VSLKSKFLYSVHLKKSHNNNNSRPRLTPRGRLVEYCVDSRHLAAHRATTSSSRATFKFLLFLGSPRNVRFSHRIYSSHAPIGNLKRLFRLFNVHTFYFYFIFRGDSLHIAPHKRKMPPRNSLNFATTVCDRNILLITQMSSISSD
jgi:hypothetical protein